MPPAMSPVASEPVPDRRSTPTVANPGRKQSRRHDFPIGARFPRRTAERELAELIDGIGAVSVTSAPIFPIGARFPRRTPEDTVRYLAELAAGPVRVTPQRRPIGARFPR